LYLLDAESCPLAAISDAQEFSTKNAEQTVLPASPASTGDWQPVPKGQHQRLRCIASPRNHPGTPLSYFEESRNSSEMLTVTTVTNFCFTYPNQDGLYSPPLNSWKIGKWLKTLGKGRFSKVFENGEKLSPLSASSLFSVGWNPS
jgi:hypothetical protein